MLKIGKGKAQISGFKKGIGMMGYGRPWNVAEEVGTELHVRTFVIKNSSSKRKVAFVNAEICFITSSIKRGVIERLMRDNPDLGYYYDNVMLTAQHTHSGPGGYSHHAFYNLSIPGYVPEVLEGIVDAIVESILQADANTKAGKLYLNRGSFQEDVEVAFNRSVEAYNLNPEVSEKATKDTRYIAVDRNMDLLTITDKDDNTEGLISWFGVHSTSISNDNKSTNYDNKGYASQFMEEHFANNKSKKDFISIFGQAKAGDVTPNWIWDKKKKWTRGKFEDDYQSARFNGELQFKKALEIEENSKDRVEVKEEIDYRLMYVDFRNVDVDPEFANNKKGMRTVPGCLGVAFFEGTVEGPGMPKIIGSVSKVLTGVIKGFELLKTTFMDKEQAEEIRLKYRFQGPKHIMVESGERKLMGTHNISKVIVPSWVDAGVKAFKEHHASGGLEGNPWTPQILPLQIFTIGQLAIVGVPGEITTIGGKRLEEMLLKKLSERGIEKVILSTYCNSYCGYITTNEEYQIQAYEGGHTVFGEWTHAGFMTKFKELASELVDNPFNERRKFKVKPIVFSEDELSKRLYHES